jgi:hypothetical protein
MRTNIEPVYLVPEGPANLTEYGKHWLDRRFHLFDIHLPAIKDVLRLARAEVWKWPDVLERLALEGVPTAISSGISQGQMGALINASTKQATYTAPAAIYGALATTAPSSTTTGSTVAEPTYTGYSRLSFASAIGAASSATPAVATNSSTLTYGNCTAGSATLAGFLLVDASSAGNGLWYGTLPSVSISTTQTPPTIATGALSLSMTGS